MAALEGPLQASWWRGDLVRVSQAPYIFAAYGKQSSH